MIAHVPAERTRQYRLKLIEEAHKRAMTRKLYQTQESMMAETLSPNLTPMQVGILERGTNEKEFKLIGGEAGKSSGYLVARSYIKAVRKGVYTLTDEGRAAYQKILNAHFTALDMTARPSEATSGINLDDPALLDDRTETTRWKQIAEDRLRKLNELNKTLDDMGKLADDLQSKLNAAVSGDEEYSQAIYQKLHDMGVTVEDIESIKASLDMDGSTYHSIGKYVEGLRFQIREQYDLIEKYKHLDGAVDQYCGQIESQRRLISELNATIEDLQRKSPRVDVMLAGQILDELCDLIPEVEAYRTARESAVKAISNLKEKR
jgi:DNA-binding PadR family transcriptional regulator